MGLTELLYVYPDLLSMLSNHEHKREVVHPESSIEEPVGVDQKDDVLHRVLDDMRVGLYAVVSIIGKTIMWLTPQSQQKRKARLRVWWSFDHVRRQDRVDVFRQVLSFQFDANGIAKLRGLFGVLRSLPGDEVSGRKGKQVSTVHTRRPSKIG